MNTFYFRLVLFPVYVCDYMQMYFVRNDEKINMFNQYTCIEETWLRQQVTANISSVWACPQELGLGIDTKMVVTLSIFRRELSNGFPLHPFNLSLPQSKLI